MKVCEVPAKETLVWNTDLFPVDQTKIYEISVPVQNLTEKNNSAFILMIFFDSDKKHCDRRYKFLKTNSVEQEVTLRCAVPYPAKFARLGFRVNCEGAIPSQSQIKIPKIEEWLLKTTDNIEEVYDDIHDYEKRYQGVDLDKDAWLVVGAPQYIKGNIKLVPGRLPILKSFGLKPNSSILDVGCGTGASVHSLEPYLVSPKNYVGTDLVKKAVDYCKQKFPEWEFHKNESSKLPDLKRKFDMIILFSVFTHLYPNEIKDMLVELKNYLKDDGCIVASVHINPFVKSEFIGTRGLTQMNQKVFFDIVNSTGFSKIRNHPSNEIGSVVYQIRF